MSEVVIHDGPLTGAEAGRLRTLERTIERGILTFVEVGVALVEIRDKRLYRTTHDSFAAYCERRWNISKRHGNRLIEAATIALDVAEDGQDQCEAGQQVGPIGPTDQPKVNGPQNEAQARELARLPDAETRKKAWKIAVAESDGQPTAKALRAVGESIVNGTKVNDPPDIARKRKAGKIAPEVVVEVTEPAGVETPEDRAVDAAEQDAKCADITDDEWLDACPVRAKLTGPRRKRFDADALTYRRLEEARKTFAHHASRIAKGTTPYAARVRRFLKTDHPKHWVLCTTEDNGGCGGTGEVTLIGACPKCHGAGYWIH